MRPGRRPQTPLSSKLPSNQSVRVSGLIFKSLSRNSPVQLIIPLIQPPNLSLDRGMLPDQPPDAPTLEPVACAPGDPAVHRPIHQSHDRRRDKEQEGNKDANGHDRDPGALLVAQARDRSPIGQCANKSANILADRDRTSRASAHAPIKAESMAPPRPW